MKKLIVLVTILLIAGAASNLQAQEKLAIIVNKQNPINNISMSQLISIYRGQETLWPNGQMIVLVNQAMGNQDRLTFYEEILGVSSATKFYISGTLAPIRSVIQSSSKGIKLFVSNMPTAIGYISQDEIDDSVKVLTIDEEKYIP